LTDRSPCETASNALYGIARRLFKSPNTVASWSLHFVARSGLDRLVVFGNAIIVVVDATSVDDLAVVDRDAIGLGADRLARRRIDIGPDAGRPAGPLRIMKRPRHAHVLQIRG